MKTFFNAALFILIFGTLLYMLPPVNEFLTAQVLTGNSQLLVSDFTFKPGDPGASTFDPSKVRKVITRVDTNTTLTRGTLGNGFELFQNLSAGEYSFEFSYDGGTLAQNNFKISTLSGFPNPPPPPGFTAQPPPLSELKIQDADTALLNLSDSILPVSFVFESASAPTTPQNLTLTIASPFTFTSGKLQPGGFDPTRVKFRIFPVGITVPVASDVGQGSELKNLSSGDYEFVFFFDSRPILDRNVQVSASSSITSPANSISVLETFKASPALAAIGKLKLRESVTIAFVFEPIPSAPNPPPTGTTPPAAIIPAPFCDAFDVNRDGVVDSNPDLNLNTDRLFNTVGGPSLCNVSSCDFNGDGITNFQDSLRFSLYLRDAADSDPNTNTPCPDKCGNGVVDPGEQCDDGNRVNGDICSSTCQTIVPGTGNTPPVGGLGSVANDLLQSYNSSRVKGDPEVRLRVLFKYLNSVLPAL